MLNGDRIRLMTEMAIYEKREGRTDEQVDAYFKSDYLSAELLTSPSMGFSRQEYWSGVPLSLLCPLKICVLKPNSQGDGSRR